MKLNLPNRLTLMRIFMIPVFIVLYFVEFEGHTLAAALVFVLASVTDFFDGYIARKRNLVTNFGKFLDPIADKMLVACALVAICVTAPAVEPRKIYYILTAVFSMLILSRDLMVSGFRTVAADKGAVIAADMFGKLKTVVQMICIFVLLPVTDFIAWNELAGTVFYYTGFALLSLATLLTILSGVHYLVKNKAVLED
ncbi:MAG: CDP-diacylglycerol--glycerol-3-phosphate 3-phosphatidyltransferase [Roseburia sp.]|nr:CDP-diacylglycerol--glycerol-3-phosphate 3-phosphatidyltransferase [Roseburia sp.]